DPKSNTANSHPKPPPQNPTTTTPPAPSTTPDPHPSERGVPAGSPSAASGVDLVRGAEPEAAVERQRSEMLGVYARRDPRRSLTEGYVCQSGGDGRANLLPLKCRCGADRTTVSSTFTPLAVPARGTSDRANFDARIIPGQPPRTRG